MFSSDLVFGQSHIAKSIPLKQGLWLFKCFNILCICLDCKEYSTKTRIVTIWIVSMISSPTIAKSIPLKQGLWWDFLGCCQVLGFHQAMANIYINSGSNSCICCSWSIAITWSKWHKAITQFEIWYKFASCFQEQMTQSNNTMQ